MARSRISKRRSRSRRSKSRTKRRSFGKRRKSRSKKRGSKSARGRFLSKLFRRFSRSKRRSSKRGLRSRRFGKGPSAYQDQVNALTGNMGPKSTAYWKDTGSTTGKPWDLGAQPLYFSPSAGKYVTSFEQNAAPQSIAFESLPNSYGVLGSWNPSKGLSFGRKRYGKKRSFGKKRRNKKKV